jgi:hypothetical protein
MAEHESYPNVDGFYDAHPAARLSPESDYGVWWKGPDGDNWRVTYVHETGHVYAIGQGGTRSGRMVLGGEDVLVVSAGKLSGPVVILGQLAPFPRELEEATRRTNRYGVAPPGPAEAALDGWVQKCGEQGSLEWALDRVQRAQVERLSRERSSELIQRSLDDNDRGAS